MSIDTNSLSKVALCVYITLRSHVSQDYPKDSMVFQSYLLFTSISILAFYFPLTTSNNLYTLAGLGITGLVAGLDLVIKGVEVGVDGLRFF